MSDIVLIKYKMKLAMPTNTDGAPTARISNSRHSTGLRRTNSVKPYTIREKTPITINRPLSRQRYKNRTEKRNPQRISLFLASPASPPDRAVPHGKIRKSSFRLPLQATFRIFVNTEPCGSALAASGTAHRSFSRTGLQSENCPTNA